MDYYSILEVDRSATTQEIKKAYKKMAIKWHPDKHTTASETEKKQMEKKFSLITMAYKILSDPGKRRLYDIQGKTDFETPSSSSSPPPPSPYSSPFYSSFFVYSDKSASDHDVPLNEIFEDMFKGSQRNNNNSNTNNNNNSSSGNNNNNPQDWSFPIFVNVTLTLEELFQGVFQKKIFVQSQDITVDIPPGLLPGTNIPIHHEKLPPNTQVYMVLQDKKHPLFERQEYDLHYTLQVDAAKIMFNQDVSIPVLSSASDSPEQQQQQPKTITIHWSDLPQPITEKTPWVIPNQGLYCDRQKTRRGNLVVHFQIEARVLQQHDLEGLKDMEEETG